MNFKIKDLKRIFIKMETQHNNKPLQLDYRAKREFYDGFVWR